MKKKKNIANSFSALSLDSGDPKDDEDRAKASTAPLSSSKNARKTVGTEKQKASTSTSSRMEGKESTKQSEEQSPCTSLKRPLVWIDLEMTGLKVEDDRILEIACIITDGQLDKTVEGPYLIINQSEECLARMNEWCQDHHSASGLVEEVRKSKVTEQEAEQQVMEFVKKYTSNAVPSLAGNSVYVDYMFLKKYMPNLADLFSHILVDVSSIRALCCRWYPKDAENVPPKKQLHRAMDDIKESIAELKYLRKTIFKASRR